MSKKVINIFFPGPFGGAEMVILEGLPELAKSIDTELWVIKETRNPNPYDEFIKRISDKKINIKTFECNSVIDFSLIKQMKEALNPDDIIHTHGLKACFYGDFIRNRHRLICTHHGNTSHTLKVRLYEFFQNRIFKKASTVIAVSEKMQEDLQFIGIDSVVIENFLSIQIEEKKEVNEPHTKLVAIGRLSKEKAIINAIKALENVKNTHLDIVGAGEKEESLKAYVKENNLEKRVIFHGFQKDIKPYLHSAHALIMPSLTEGLPMTLIEAICMGLPVIGSNVGALSYLIKDNGIISPPGDIQALKKGLKIFNQDRSYFIENAKQKAIDYRNRFSLKNWIQKTLKQY